MKETPTRIQFHNQSLMPTGRPGKFYFVQNPRTASTSISLALGLTPKQHLPAQVLRTQEDYYNVFTFGFVRNPYTRILSQYRNRIKANQNGERSQGLTFDQFIKLTLEDKAKPFYNNPWMFRPQKDWLYYSDDLLVDYVGKYEQLNKDWTTVTMILTGWYDIVPPPLPTTNKTHEPEDWQDFFALKKTRDLVERQYEVDFETFRYKKLL